MISKEQSQKIAKDEFARSLKEGDELLQSWSQATVGKSVVVHDVNGKPDYWIVPFTARGHVVAFVRVSDCGSVLGIGTFCSHSDSISRCPKHVTGLAVEQARLRVVSEVKPGANETIGDPVYVHDGPIGREAWMVVVSNKLGPKRWLFVTESGIYERPAGQVLPESPEA